MASFLLCLYLTALINLGWSFPHPQSKTPSLQAKAIYFLDNKVQNSVVALTVNSNGTLSDGSLTPTGGAGGVSVHPNSPLDVPDVLFSSGSVQVFEDVLLAVNAGSNSVSMFQIDPDEPTKLTQIGLPVDTQGNFPVSIAVSKTLNQACVANTGPQSGIACFHMNKIQGLIHTSSFRSIPLNQTNPPTGPPLLPLITSIAFVSNPPSLIATITSSTSTQHPSTLALYPLINDTISLTPSFINPNNTVFIFSTLPIPNTPNLFITDVTFGTAIINLTPNYIGTTSETTTIPNQRGTCWTSLSPYTNTVFASDALVNRIVELDLYSGAIISFVNVTNGNQGNLDSVAAGDKVYFLSPGFTASSTAVVVLDVSGGPGKGRVVQSFQPQNLGVDVRAQGMAFYS